MRALKVALVAVSLTASLVVGVASTADAASKPAPAPRGLWCC